jgi:hypothetical protein
MKKVIVVLGILLLASTAVSAAVMTESRGATIGANPSTGAVLWSQLDEPTGGAFTDQAFEASYAAYDADGGEDFVVTAGTSWDLEALFTPGSLTVAGSNPFFVNILFYGDSGGLPGAVLCDFTANTDVTSAGDGDLTMDVTGCNLAEGNVWFSQSVRMDFNPLGQHYWATRGTAAGTYPGVWKNPGNGFGNGCLDWQPANAVCGMTGEDWMFELTGTENTGGGGEGVPAIGPFGALLMIVSLGAGSAYVLRRRRA